MRPIFGMMRGFLLAIMLGLGTLFAVATPASAYMCGTRADLVRYLDKTFQEKPAALGLLARGEQLAELFVSASGSWTLIVSMPQGHSCVIASGDNWTAIPDLGPGA